MSMSMSMSTLHQFSLATITSFLGAIDYFGGVIFFIWYALELRLGDSCTNLSVTYTLISSTQQNRGTTSTQFKPTCPIFDQNANQSSTT
jgi:hypothetical protein